MKRQRRLSSGIRFRYRRIQRILPRLRICAVGADRHSSGIPGGGYFLSRVLGVGLEWRTTIATGIIHLIHWTPMRGANSYKDLYNDGIGIEGGGIAVLNNWTQDQVGDLSANAVRLRVNGESAAIVSIFDTRIPTNLNKISTFDYVFAADNNKDLAKLRDIVPPGTVLPNQSIDAGATFSSVPGTEIVSGNDGPLFQVRTMAMAPPSSLHSQERAAA